MKMMVEKHRKLRKNLKKKISKNYKKSIKNRQTKIENWVKIDLYQSKKSLKIIENWTKKQIKMGKKCKNSSKIKKIF